MEDRPGKMGNRPAQDFWDYSCSMFPPAFNAASVKVNTAKEKKKGGGGGGAK